MYSNLPMLSKLWFFCMWSTISKSSAPI